MNLDGEKILVRVIVAWNGPESFIPPKGYIDEKTFFSWYIESAQSALVSGDESKTLTHSDL